MNFQFISNPPLSMEPRNGCRTANKFSDELRIEQNHHSMCSGNETANIYFWSHLLNQKESGISHWSLTYLWLQSWSYGECMHAQKYACIPARDTPPAFHHSFPLLDKLKFWWMMKNPPALSPTQSYTPIPNLYMSISRSDTEPQQCSQVQMLSSF